MKFSEYREMRDTIEFDRKFSLLCESIARSGYTFDEWWSHQALPILTEAYRYDNEEELMLEFMGGVGSAMGNMAGRAWQGVKNLGRGAAHGWGAGQQAAGQWQPQGAAGAEQPMDIPPENFVDPNAAAAGGQQPPMQDPNAAAAGGPEAAAQQAPAMSPEKQQRLDAFQRGIDQSTDQIKQRFSGAMRDFLQAVQGDAKQQDNAHMWQIAKNFQKQVMDAAQPAIDSFKQTAKYGQRQQGGYQDQFAQDRGAMQQGQQADLKSRLQAKHGQGGQQTAGAPQNLQQPQAAPQQPDMTTPIGQLAKQQFPAGAHMRPGMAVA
jgi:hypothetical protein